MCMLFVLGGLKAFSQCTVSGTDSKKITVYKNAQQIKKDLKNVKKNAKKDGHSLVISIPKDSSCANIEFIKEVSDLFDGSYVDMLQYNEESFASSDNEIFIRIERISGKYVVKSITGLTTSKKLAEARAEAREKALKKEMDENRRNGYGDVTDAERDELVSKITKLKNEFKITENKSLASSIKAYESRKEYVYALALYYEQDQNLNSEYNRYEDGVKEILTGVEGLPYYKSKSPYYSIVPDALKTDTEYKKIIAVIKGGNPWTGKYDDFSRYDGFKILLKNFEKYFTEYPTFYLAFMPPKKVEANMQNRTYTYGTYFTANRTDFFIELLGAIQAGLKVSSDSSWTEIPEEWPARTILFGGETPFTTDSFGEAFKERKSYYVDGIAITAMYQSFDKEAATKKEAYKIARQLYGNSAYYDILEKALNNDIAAMRKYGYTKLAGTPTLASSLMGIPYYGIRCNIVDDNGKVLAAGESKFVFEIEMGNGENVSGDEYNNRGYDEESARGYEEKVFDAKTGEFALVRKSRAYTFKGLSSATASLIDEGKAHVELAEIKLYYGAASANVSAVTDIKKMLSTLPVPLKNLSVYWCIPIMNKKTGEYEYKYIQQKN